MKSFYFILVVLFVTSLNAQTKYFETNIDETRADLAEIGKEIVAQNVEMTPDQATIFWPLFDEYDKEDHQLGDKEVEILENYMLNYYAMDQEEGSKILNDIMQIRLDRLNLEKEYVDKMNNVLPFNVVGKFYQVNRRLNLLIDVQKAVKIPLLREPE